MHPIQEGLNRMVTAGLPGAFIYVDQDNGEARFYTAGFADLETRRRMTPDSRYRVGSTTKTLVAVVILQLAAEGRLGLADTLADWLPELPIPNGEVLTVEDLLRMRSGLFDFEDDASLLNSLPAHRVPHTLRRVVDLAIGHPSVFPPGTRFSYCNTNFCILELIIERITRHSLAEEFTARIFEPLGMSNSSYPEESDLTLPEPYIRGYDRRKDGWLECSQVFFGRGDGALLSTAIDLSRFFRALILEHALLPEDSLKRMMTILPDQPPAVKSYGLGLIRESLPCGEVWGHSGRGFGYQHFPFLQIESKRFAICMLNGTYGFQPKPEKSATAPPGFTMELRAMPYG